MSINQFNLKDKENIIINNPSGFKRLEEEKTEINLDFQIENCIKIVMVNGKLNTDLSDPIPENYHIDSINNSNKESLSKVAGLKHPVVTNNTENFKNGLYIESKQEHLVFLSEHQPSGGLEEFPQTKSPFRMPGREF